MGGTKKLGTAYPDFCGRTLRSNYYTELYTKVGYIELLDTKAGYTELDAKAGYTESRCEGKSYRTTPEGRLSELSRRKGKSYRTI